jgi:hypothetical protein
MATRKPMKKFKRYEGGGEVMGEMDPMEAAAKKRGLEMSNKEAPVGFFERLRMGNIDQPGSEAYNRFGAGRGRDRGEAVSVNQPMPAAPAMPAASSRPLSDDMYSDYGPSAGRSSSETITPTRPAATKPVVPAKPAATPVPPLRNTGPDRSSLINKPSLNTNYSNEGRNKPAPAAPAKPSMDIPAMRDNAKAALAEDPSALMPGVGAGAAAAAAALLAKTKLGKLGKMFRGGNKSSGRDLVVSPSKGPTMGKADDDRAASAYDKLKKSSFVKKGDDVTDVTPKSKSTTMKQLGKPTSKKPLDESDTTGGAIGYKRGGKMKKYASGGMVSSASKRADGIATKGKTRCKIC